jgi:hypothetical protein
MNLDKTKRKKKELNLALFAFGRFFLILLVGMVIYVTLRWVEDKMASPPPKIAALPYTGPQGCMRYGIVEITKDGCYSNRNFIPDGRKFGFRHRGNGRGADNITFDGYFRVDNNAVGVKCFKLFNGEKRCSVTSVDVDVFVVASGSDK